MRRKQVLEKIDEREVLTTSRRHVKVIDDACVEVKGGSLLAMTRMLAMNYYAYETGSSLWTLLHENTMRLLFLSIILLSGLSQ